MAAKRKRRYPLTLVPPGTLCDQCMKGVLQLTEYGTTYRSVSGTDITSVPLMRCSVCQQDGQDLQLLVEIEESLRRLRHTYKRLPTTLSFVHLGIVIPFPLQNLAS